MPISYMPAMAFCFWNGINVEEDHGVVEKYRTENGVDYPIALDADGQVASDYNVRGFPIDHLPRR